LIIIRHENYNSGLGLLLTLNQINHWQWCIQSLAMVYTIIGNGVYIVD